MTRPDRALGLAAVALCCSACADVGSGADKADADHTHDDRYFTEGEADAALGGKSDALHTHDDRYYTVGDVDSSLAGKADALHTHDDRYYTRAEIDAAVSAVAPTAFVATVGSAFIGPNSEANAAQQLIKFSPTPGRYLARLDAELSTFGALYFVYNCKLQYKSYPAVFGSPFTDLPGTRRTVSWRLGRAENGPGVPVSISMQAPVTAGGFGLEVRLVCWGELDGTSPPIVDYGVGITSATLVLERFSSVN